MTVHMTGLFTPPAPEDRDIAYLEVERNGNTYVWSVFLPQGVNVGEYLASIEQRIYDEIDYKENLWQNLDPKTMTVLNEQDEEVVVNIQKEEIVKPDNPDYYALRRGEYPKLGDQLDAFWKGPDYQTYNQMMSKIQEVKNKYPKPPYI